MLSLIITLVLIGIALYLINSFIPMDQKIKTILNIVIVVVVILYVCNSFGLLGYLNNASVPKIH